MSAPGLAEDKPFVLEALHTNLTMREALARAEALGGTCVPVQARRNVGGLKSRCNFTACDLAKGAKSCAPEKLQASTFKIAGQPVHTLDIEAPAEDKRLRNMTLFYEGDVEAVMNRMREWYGEPEFDTEPQLEKSWTPSRRLMWQRGIQRATFVTHPQMILLAADRPQYGGKI